MTKQKLVLALDTASDAIALAVGALDTSLDVPAIELLASKDMMARREANIQLVPAIEQLFSEQQLSKEDVVCVVCGRGPGSFTGVRIAVATAKGIAAGLKVPLYGVATPDALAWQAWLGGVRGYIAVLLDAMRGEVYPARYTLDEEGVRREDALTVVKADVLAEKWESDKGNLTLTGDALYKYGELFSGFEWLPEEHWRPKGVGLVKAFEVTPESSVQENSVQESSVRESSNSAVSKSIASLLPIYTRLSDAEENERKRLASGGEIAQGAIAEVPASGVARQEHPEQNIYRPAAKKDIPAIVALEQHAYAHATNSLNGECWTQAMYEAELTQLDRSWWVCYQNEELVGFIGGHHIDGQTHVLDVVVSELHRRQGIARHLLVLLARDAKDLGATALTLEVRTSNAAAQTLYRELGLKEEGRRKRYYAPLEPGEPREDAVIMTGSVEAVISAGEGVFGNEEKLFEQEAPAGSFDATLAEHPLVLAIESSCDETAAALIDGRGKLLQNVIASQTDFHARFGGVVPEIASRKHTEAIYPVVMEALGEFNWKDLDAITVTYAPGLIGALVVGMAFAKGLCWATDLPLIKVNHLEGHIYANRFILSSEPDATYEIDESLLQPPFVIALLSGGNTQLVHVKNWGDYHVLGETLDDAIGEAYDKVAKALGLGYPGGPVIARLAEEGNAKAFDFPRALLHSHDYQFSFSGLKTAVLTVIREQVAAGTLNLPDIAASFEKAVIEVQVRKALDACLEQGVETFCIGGGVAANKALRQAYKEAMEPRNIRVLFPPQIACTDNAAMIAAAALDRYFLGKFASLSDDAEANANLELPY